MIVTADSPPSIRTQGAGWRSEWLLSIAEAIGSAADCTRRRVGAVLAHPSSFQILGGGYNGLPSQAGGCWSTGACPRGQLTHEQLPGLVTPYSAGPGRCPSLHAERNAIARALEAGHVLVGAVMAVTDEPCPDCRALIASHRIGLVVWPGGEWNLTRPATREGEAP